MPVYRLVEELVFPPPGLAEPSGLLAVGGDLSSARLLLAYSMGIFPWFNDDDPLLWWSPDPRCVLLPDELHISRSLAKTIRRGCYRVTFDRAFGEVIAACAGVRQEQGDETWITLEMLEAYQRLHRQGYAHSVECWQGDELVGGLYGVCLGRFFFGESMFHRHADASKVAFAALVQSLKAKQFLAVDCQLPTSHLQSLGAKNISRKEFLDLLSQGDLHPTTHPSRGLFPAAPMTIAAA